MYTVKKSKVLSTSFMTEGGVELKSPVMAYEEYGNSEGPVILIAHGGLSNHHSAGVYTENGTAPGWWDPIIGPGKAFDTRRFRIISFNALGSMFGTTGPVSINPDTGKAYQADFPEITMIDMSRFLKAFLEEMGIFKVLLMAGPSMGSLLSLQTAALYPKLIESVMAVATAGRMPPGGMAMHRLIIHTLASDPEFNNGYYGPGKVSRGLQSVHEIARIYYTHERIIEKLCWSNVSEGPDAQSKRSDLVENYLTTGMEDQIAGRDPMSYIRLVSAVNTFNLGRDAASYEEGVRRIKCPVLLINLATDAEFPPRWGREVGEILNAKNPGQAEFHVLDSDWGHVGCLREAPEINKLAKVFVNKI